METDCLNTGTDKLLVYVKDRNIHANIILESEKFVPLRSQGIPIAS